MLDNELILLVIDVIKTGLAQRSLTGYIVKQSVQPTQSGRLSSPVIYLHKLDDIRYGFTKRISRWDSALSKMYYTEEQQYQTSFQVDAFVIQNPADTTSKTASDIVNIVAEIMNSAPTLETLLENGVQILRITNVRNNYFLNDTNVFEAAPSFDFILSYTRSTTTEINSTNELQSGIYRI